MVSLITKECLHSFKNILNQKFHWKAIILFIYVFEGNISLKLQIFTKNTELVNGMSSSFIYNK